VLRSHQWRTAENSAAFLLPHLGEGISLLDVGCGPGNITAELATYVGSGEVTGIDLSEEVIALAKRDFMSVGLDNLFFETGDVYALDFPDDHFDVVYAHQILQHLTRPVEAIREMRRVLKPGGLLAVREGDFGAFVWFPGDPVLSRWMELYHQLTRRNDANCDAGRNLKSWVLDGGFTNVDTSLSNWTYQTSDERAWWGGLWADRVRYSEFARQCVEYGLSTEDELALIAEAFLRWSNELDGVFIVVNVEVLASK
jgi:ubiquinone/menaquinone biosynthesis C-methylase UbiE